LRSEIEGVRTAVASVVPKLTALLRSVRRPELHSLGEWTVAEVAAHLSHVYRADVAAAKGGFPDVGPKDVTPGFVGAVSTMNADFLHNDPERDLGALAARIEGCAEDFMAVLSNQPGDQPVVWLGGVKLPLWSVGAHLVSESLIHGFDIARPEGLPWSIEPAHAALATRFSFAFLHAIDPDSRRVFINRAKADGLRACVDFRLRDNGSLFVIVEDGTVLIEEPSDRRKIDCHISADPVALLLMSYGRIGRWAPLLKGQLVAWGRRPWLAAAINGLFKTP
jgi:hypothetical protein